MECEINHMVRAGVDSKELTIGHVRDPGEWVPVSGERIGKGP